MHKEVLTQEQIELLPLVNELVRKNFGLVGGTAIALQIGHRRSVDFDLFTLKEFSNGKVRDIIRENKRAISRVYKDEDGQFTFLINSVQFTFFHYPFKIQFSERFEGKLIMPDLLTLGAMKAYALGRRAKWKDYVDLYFIISKYHSVNKLVEKSQEIYAGEFNERIFREQLSYFYDISYDEPVEFLPGFEVDDEIVKKELVEFSIS